MATNTTSSSPAATVTLCFLDASGRPAVSFSFDTGGDGGGGKNNEDSDDDDESDDDASSPPSSTTSSTNADWWTSTLAWDRSEGAAEKAAPPIRVHADARFAPRLDDSVYQLRRKLVRGALHAAATTTVATPLALGAVTVQSLRDWTTASSGSTGSGSSSSSPAEDVLLDLVRPMEFDFGGAAEDDGGAEDRLAEARNNNIYLFGAIPHRAAVDWLAIYLNLVRGERAPMTAGTWLAVLRNWFHVHPRTGKSIPLDSWARGRAAHLFVAPDASLRYESIRDQLQLPSTDLWRWAPLGLRRVPTAVGAAQIAVQNQRVLADLTALTPIAGGVWPAISSSATAAPAAAEVPPSAQWANMQLAATDPAQHQMRLLDTSSFNWYPEPADAVFRAAAAPSPTAPAMVFGFTRATLRAYLRGRCSDAEALLSQFFFMPAASRLAPFSAGDRARLRAEAELAASSSSSFSSAADDGGKKVPPPPLLLQQHGVTRFHAVLHPTRKIKLPLEPVFNLVHTTARMPVVAFNDDAATSAPMLRLYTAGRLADSGRRVPALSQTALAKIKDEVNAARKVKGAHVLFLVPLMRTWRQQQQRTTTTPATGDKNAAAAAAEQQQPDAAFGSFKLNSVQERASVYDADMGSGRMISVALFQTGQLEIKTVGTGSSEEPVPHTDLDAWLQFHLWPVADALNAVLDQAGMQLHADSLRADDENMEILGMDWRASADDMLLSDAAFQDSIRSFLAPAAAGDDEDDEGGGRNQEEGGGGGGGAEYFRYTRVEFFRPMSKLQVAMISLARSAVAQRESGRASALNQMLLSNLRTRFPGIGAETLALAVASMESNDEYRPIASAHFRDPVRLVLRVNPGLLTEFKRTSPFLRQGTVAVGSVQTVAHLRFLVMHLDAALRRAAVLRTTSRRSGSGTSSSSSLALPALPPSAAPSPEVRAMDSAARAALFAAPPQQRLSAVHEEGEEEEEEEEEAEDAAADEEIDDEFQLYFDDDADESAIAAAAAAYEDDDDEQEEEEEEEEQAGRVVGGAGTAKAAKTTKPKKRKAAAMASTGDDSSSSTTSTASDDAAPQKKRGAADRLTGAHDAFALAHIKDQYAGVDPAYFSNSWYPRACPTERQPMVLTQSQLDAVAKRYAGSASKPFDPKHPLVKFGTSRRDPSQALYWACPRFWCTRPGSEGPLTEAEANDPAVCGLRAPKGRRDPERNEFVVERPNKTVPGMSTVTNTTLRDGTKVKMAAPCCFGATSGALAAASAREARRLFGDASRAEEDEAAELAARKMSNNEVRKVQRADWRPLAPEGTGQIDVTGALQRLLRTPVPTLDREKPVPGAPAFLLRYGVAVRDDGWPANYADQPFLGCIFACLHAVSAATSSADGAPVSSIAKLRQVIANTVHLDLFVRLNNATLVQLFCGDPPLLAASTAASAASVLPPSDDVERDYPPVPAADHARYSASSLLFRALDVEGNPAHARFYRKAAAAHRAFLKYLRDPRQTLEPMYLWELLSAPNARLFPEGVNLVVFEQTEDDPAANYQLLCPQQSYLARPFRAEKPSLMLLRTSLPDRSSAAAARTEVWFEPLVLFHMTNKPNGGDGVNKYVRWVISPSMVDPVARALYLRLKELLERAPCNAAFDTSSSSSNNNVPAEVAHARIGAASRGTRLLCQVLNFQGKCVGLFYAVPAVVGGPPVRVVVPTLPSAPLSGAENLVPTRFVDDPRLYQHTVFADAVLALRRLHAEAGVPCAPAARIVVDGMVVGLTTQTHQMVRARPEPYSPEAAWRSDGLPTRAAEQEAGDVAADTAAAFAAAGEEDGISSAAAEAVMLDGDMYDAYLRAARAALALYEHRGARAKLVALGLNRRAPLAERRRAAVVLLRRLLPASRVVFVDGNSGKRGQYVLPVRRPAEARRVLQNPQTREWAHTAAGALVLPDRLFAHPDKRTEAVFLLKLADQMLRHRWQQTYLLRPEIAYLFDADTMKVRDDETVLNLAMLQRPEFLATLAIAPGAAPGVPTIYDFHRASEQQPPVDVPQL